MHASKLFSTLFAALAVASPVAESNSNSNDILARDDLTPAVRSVLEGMSVEERDGATVIEARGYTTCSACSKGKKFCYYCDGACGPGYPVSC
jgi:hypothetical protein